MSGEGLLVISREEVAAHLGYEACIPLMREAMTALSTGRTRQLLRAILDLEGGRAFGATLGAMEATFGAKLISVFPAAASGAPSHQGFVALFDPETGAPAAIVGASRAGPVEIDTALVRRARVFADHKEGVLRQGAEWLVAVAEGAVGEEHPRGEIGEVFAGTLPGRTGAADVTIYKSLGSIVQDLAAGWYLVRRAREEGFGTRVPF